MLHYITPHWVQKAPNLKNMLVRAHLPPLTPSTTFFAVYSLWELQMWQLHSMQLHTPSNHPCTGKPYDVKTLFFFHLLKCPCGLAHVGKTTRPLKIRISEHRSNIHNHDIPVAVHFSQASHNVSSLRYCGIELVKQPFRRGDVNLCY